MTDTGTAAATAQRSRWRGLYYQQQTPTRPGEWGAGPAIRGWGRSDSELGPGSVSGGPHLSAGFIGTLTSG